MEYITNTTEFHFQNTVVALGKFEGMHKGHQQLLDELDRLKQEKGYTSVMFTFDRPPKLVITGKRERTIYTKGERRHKLQQTSLDVLIEQPFTPEFSKLSPEEFIKTVLIDKLDVKAIVVGFDFGFGYKRQGNVALLKELAPKYGYELIVVPKCTVEGEKSSSTLIRKYLEEGNMEKVNAFLDEPYSVIEHVVHGNAIGRSLIGLPTANLFPRPHKLLPPKGVYVTRIKLKGETFYGITNIGTKPTVEDYEIIGVETYIFDFDRDIYDELIQVEFLHYKRPEMKFSGLEELAKQMKADAAYGLEYVKKHYGYVSRS
jgi:riboflavin kinase/FMN adenylyltransferase